MRNTLYYIKKTIFTVFIATFLLSLGASFTSIYTLEKYCESKEISVPDIPSKDVSSPAQPIVYYLIKEYNEIIGVFDSSGELMYTVEVYVKTLPIADRALLKNGIRASSYGELLEVLGDYTA